MKKKNPERVTLREIKTTLEELSEAMGFVVKHMVTKEELDEKLNKGLSSLRMELKGDMFALQTQVNGMEADIRELKREWIHSRR